MVIATVFLTIIGLTAGFVLGERRNNASTEPGDSPVSVPGTSAPATNQDSTGAACPPETIATAAKLELPTDLRQTMKVRTNKGTIVWICTDGTGAYYYQSQTVTDDGELVQGRNGLFLPKVQQVDTDHYEVTDHKGTTRIVVTENRLQIDFPDRTRQIDRVVSVE